MNRRLIFLLPAVAAGLFAQTTCRVGDLPMTGSVQGTFTGTDCQAVRYLGDVPDPGGAQGWILTATSRSAVYRFRLSATQAPVRLYLTDLASTLGGAEAQSAGAAAELSVQLTAGRYLLVAVTGSTALGSYTLSSENRPPQNCETKPVEPGTDTGASLSADGCTVPELLPLLTDNSPVQPYRLSVRTPAIVRLSATSSDFKPSLVVLNATGQYESFEAAVEMSLDPGDYTILAGTADGKLGAYTLRVDLEERRPCPVTPLTAGDRAAGQLDASGCRIMDALGGQTDSRPVARYEFELAAPALAISTLTSREFDTDLYLLDGKQNVIASNDDADLTTTNSAVGSSLSPGKYTLLATLVDGRPGTFEVGLTTEPTRTCAPTPLALPGNTSGALTSAGCRYLDAVQPAASTRPAAVFALTVPRTAFVTLTAAAPGFSLGLELRTASGELISSTSRTNQVAQLVLAGEYRVVAYSGGQTGAFGITASLREPAACAPTTLPSDGTPVSASLTASGCALRELVPLPTATTASNLFAIEIEKPGRLRVAVETTAFVPGVLLLAPDGKVVTSSLAEAETAVEPGRWLAIVTTASPAGGDYRVIAVQPTAN